MSQLATPINVVLKVNTADHGPVPTEFFARTRQKYLVWLWNGPVCQLVFTRFESSLKMLVKSESRATWNLYDTAFWGTLQTKTGAAVTSSALSGGKISVTAGGGGSGEKRDVLEYALVPAAFVALTLQ